MELLSYTRYDERDMWTRVNEEVDALVQFQREFTVPVLKSINWKGRRRNFVGIPVVEGDPESLFFDCRDRSTRYAVRFDKGRQRWTLEGYDDSGIMAPREMPRPRHFPPPV